MLRSRRREAGEGTSARSAASDIGRGVHPWHFTSIRARQARPSPIVSTARRAAVSPRCCPGDRPRIDGPPGAAKRGVPNQRDGARTLQKSRGPGGHRFAEPPRVISRERACERRSRSHPRDKVDRAPTRSSGRPPFGGRGTIYLLLQSRAGVVSTVHDPEGRPTVREILRPYRSASFRWGARYHTSGAPLTNDGDSATRSSPQARRP